MKKFLAIYTGTPQALARSGWADLSEADRKAREQEGMKAWHAFGAKNASRIAEQGGPLGKTKFVGRDGISDIKNAIAGYVVVEAETHEEAAKLFEGHPHFTIFPGEGVEIMECLPIPTA